MQTVQYLVSGRVQGVFFRASTKSVADQLQITGYAKNLADGRVEILAQGEVTAIEALQDFLQNGPPHASVTALDSLILDTDQHFHEFSIA